jgi:hypothetical protein
MSRRTGPGGRLRPAAHVNRPAGRAGLAGPSGLSASADAGPGERERELIAPEQPRPSRVAALIVSPGAAVGPAPLPLADGNLRLVVGESFEDEGGPVPEPSGPAREHRSGRREQANAPHLRPPGRQLRPGQGSEGRPDPADRLVAADAPAAGERPAPMDRPVGTCTAPQLRRFIKSRAYIPMHELRRRFAIEGSDDDVSPMDLPAGRVFAGLPPAEARLLADLMRSGDVGFELSMDPQTPVVVGVYAMRPVPRP